MWGQIELHRRDEERKKERERERHETKKEWRASSRRGQGRRQEEEEEEEEQEQQQQHQQQCAIVLLEAAQECGKTTIAFAQALKMTALDPRHEVAFLCFKSKMYASPPRMQCGGGNGGGGGGQAASSMEDESAMQRIKMHYFRDANVSTLIDFCSHVHELETMPALIVIDDFHILMANANARQLVTTLAILENARAHAEAASAAGKQCGVLLVVDHNFFQKYENDVNVEAAVGRWIQQRVVLREAQALRVGRKQETQRPKTFVARSDGQLRFRYRMIGTDTFELV